MKNKVPNHSAPRVAALRSPVRSGLPCRPRFLHELAVIETDDQLLIDGLGQLHVFAGESSRTLLAPLIKLMDGSRTVDQIGTALQQFPLGDVAKAISMLHQWGLVEDGAAYRTAELLEENSTLAFFRRNIGMGRVNRSGREAYERIRKSEVLVCASPSAARAADKVKAQLSEAGIENVISLNMSSLPSDRRPLASPDQSLIVSLSSGGEDRIRQEALDDWCRDHHISWLRATIDEASGYADIGPHFKGRETICYKCFSSLHGRRCSSQKTTRHSQIDESVFSGLLSIEIIYMLSDLGPRVTARDFQRYSLPAWKLKHLGLSRIPGCPRCRPGMSDAIVSTNTHVNTAVLFEDYIGLQSRPTTFFIRQAKPIQGMEDTSLQTSRFQSCVQYPLTRQIPASDGEARGMATEPQAPISLDELASILMMTAGIRHLSNRFTKSRRWAATAGNLGSVELFIAVRDVTNLPEGVYFYEPTQHTLSLFKRHDANSSITSLMRRICPQCAETDLPFVLVFFTGAFHRLAVKYGPFGYRLVNMDAGVAFSQMQVVAQTMGLSATMLARWPDDLIEHELNLDTFEQQCTAVAALSRDNIPSFRWQRPMPETPRPLSRSSAHEDLDLKDLTRILFTESRVRETDLSLAFQPVPPALLANPPDRAAVTALPASSQISGKVGEILLKRRSVRNFSEASISLEQLSMMLHYAHQGDRNDFQSEHQALMPLVFQVLVTNVNGLGPGVYEYLAADNGLARTKATLTHKEMVGLFIQSEFATAPAVVWISGNLAASCARHGEFGHRQLLLRAGMAANRLWMAALSRGIEGAITAGVVPGYAREQLDLNGYTRASLLAFATGHADEPVGYTENESENDLCNEGLGNDDENEY